MPAVYSRTEADAVIAAAIAAIPAGSAGSGASVLSVAAWNASAAVRARADYLCDGVDDHVQINAALVAAKAISTGTTGHAGGIVDLSAGNFNGGQLVQQNHTGLRGAGRNATHYKLKNGVNTDAIINFVSTDAGVTVPNALFTYLGHFTLDGNKANQTAGAGIYHTRSPSLGNSAANNQFASSGDWDSHHIVEHMLVTNVKTTGYYFNGLSGSSFIDCQAYYCNDYGFYCGVDTEYIGCQSGGAGLAGFRISTTSSRLIGCKSFYSGEVTPSLGYGFLLSSAYGNQLIGCDAQDNRAAGFMLSGYCKSNKIIGTADTNATSFTSGGYAIGFINGGNIQSHNDIQVNCHEGNYTSASTAGQKYALDLISSAQNNKIQVMHTGIYRNADAAVLPLAVTPGSTVDKSNRITINGNAYQTSTLNTASYTLTVDDVHVRQNSASATVVTVPTNAAAPMPIGKVITVSRIGTGPVTFAGSVTFVGPTTLALNATAALRQAAVDVWEVDTPLEPVTPTALTPTTGTATIDFSAAGLRTQALTGDVTYASSALAEGRTVTVRVTAAALRNLAFPSGWVFVGTKPASIAAGKTGLLSLISFGTTDADVVAGWAVQT